MNQIDIRKKVFLFLATALLIFLVPFEIFDWADSALVLYGITLVFITFCLSFWIWWGTNSRNRPTDEFIIVGALMASLWLVVAFNFYARWVFVFYSDNYSEFLRSVFWSYRVLPELLVFMLLSAWIVGRVFGALEQQENLKNGHRPGILIIEDDKSMSALIKASLEPICSFQIDQAFTKEEARSRFVPDKYACITLDLNLGHSISDGAELALEFRKQDPNVYIVIISGHVDEVRSTPMMNAVDDFITKPFDIDYLQLKALMWVLKYKRRLLNLQRSTSLDLK